MGYSFGMRALKVHVRPLPFTVVAVAAALASALGGCISGGGPATDGPLNSNGADGRPARGAACVPGQLGQPRTFGIELFTNHGHANVVLDRVALRNPNHERLVGSYAVPGEFLIGVVAWPPRYAGMPPTWKHRQPVHGFQLVPRKSFNMVLGVAATALGRASSRGMLVYYHDSAGSYVTRDDVAMIIATTKRGCDLKLTFRFAPLTPSAAPRSNPPDHSTAVPKSPWKSLRLVPKAPGGILTDDLAATMLGGIPGAAPRERLRHHPVTESAFRISF